MARIGEDEIERLKREIAVERLAEARGIALKKHGSDLHGLCPFHEDREPSLVITPEKNLWHCLGACQTGGSVIDWVMRAEGVSFRHAVEWLRGTPIAASPVMSSSGALPKESTVRKLPTLLARDADDDALLLRVVDYYHRSLKESPEALAYLQSRGLVNAEMIDHFRLGFANRTLGYRLPEKNRKEGQEVRGRLQTLGILRESGHEHMNGSIVIPVFDQAGRVTEMYGRKITAGLRPGTPLHMYLPGPHYGVWNKQALEVSDEVILCESLIDALTFWCAGIRNVTASYGVEGFTNDHWTALRRYGTRCVRIAYDRDEAGDRAAERLSAELNAEGIETYRIQFPKGMDANEYALKMQPASRALELVVRQAVWMGKGIEPKTRSTEAAKEKIEIAIADSFPPLAASSLAAPEPPELAAASSPEGAPQGDELVMQLGDRRWRIRGVSKNLSHEQMKVNVLVAREEAGFFVDTMELYSARQRAAFVKSASEEVGVEERILKKDLGEVLLRLEALQEAQIRAVLKPKDDAVKVTDADREAGLELLRDPKLLDRILADFERCGVVGEETNKLVGYLAAVSRKLEQPLGVVIQSSSAAGKSSLMEAILSLMPEEERVQYSAMTGQSLFYMGEEDLKHKILAVVEEEGASRASYALKLLQSEGELTIASTGKDPATGKLVTHAYRVEGPVMIFLTTTAIEVDEELLNRCIVLTVDEGRAQTRAIHAQQREGQTLEGLILKEERKKIRAVHKNAQRLLRPLFVANPYARELTFVDTRTRTRRDHMKYLTLIRTIALLHQHQRRVQMHEGREYIEATREDIATADKLAAAVLARSLDELPPQTRRLLGLVEEIVVSRAKAMGVDRSDVRFTRREIREEIAWGNTQLKIHLSRLEELEYVLVHRGAYGQSWAYELCYDGDRSGQKVDRSGIGRPSVGGWSGVGRGTRAVIKPLQNGPIGDRVADDSENSRLGSRLNGTSY